MEFHEKLQELRKSRGMTQEELAEALFVSRTAISKWESGRGYPNIDSLKELSRFFAVSIDELLSGDKLISIAEKENQSNLRNLCELLFGVTDIFSLALIFLPLYPNEMNGYIYSVNLLAYVQNESAILALHWVFFCALILVGILKLLLIQLRIQKGQKTVTYCSVILGIAVVLYLAMTREAYAISVAVLLLVFKGLLILKGANTGK